MLSRDGMRKTLICAEFLWKALVIKALWSSCSWSCHDRFVCFAPGTSATSSTTAWNDCCYWVLSCWEIYVLYGFVFTMKQSNLSAIKAASISLTSNFGYFPSRILQTQRVEDTETMCGSLENFEKRKRGSFFLHCRSNSCTRNLEWT